MLYDCFNYLPQANNTVKVNSVQIPDSDVMATNGVIHFVDQVLYPGGMTFILFPPFKTSAKACKSLNVANALSCRYPCGEPGSPCGTEQAHHLHAN